MVYTGWIYKWTNKVNGKVYIGQTMNKRGYKERWSQHISLAKRETNPKNYFYNAIRKYGSNGFEKEILFEVHESTHIKLKNKLDKLEIKEIKKYGAFDYKRGYNSTMGGESTIWSLPNGDDRLKKIKKIWEKRGEELKEKLSKKVVLLTESEELIQAFSSIKECSDYLKISENSIVYICRGGKFRKAGIFERGGGKMRDGRKIRYTEDWVDGLTISQIQYKYGGVDNHIEEVYFSEIEDTPLTDVYGRSFENVGIKEGETRKNFRESGMNLLTKRQKEFINNPFSVNPANRKRIIRTIQKRLGLTNN